MIALSGVDFSYGTRRVLEGVTLRIDKGEIVGLLGPNGAGKTTIVRLILGLLEPACGGVGVIGFNPSRSPREVKSQIGVVHQKSNFDWDLSLYDNLEVYGALHGIPRAARHNRIDDLLEEFGLSSVRKQTIRTLSGGEQRRAQLARALVHQPRILVLDEPSVNLDSQWRLRLQERVKQRAKEEGTTVLWTSHDLREIEEATTRIIVVNGGRVIADDLPHVFARRLSGEFLRILVANRNGLAHSVPGAIDYRWDNDWWIGRVDSAEERLPEVLQYFFDNGLRVEKVRVETASLEKAILESDWGLRHHG